MIIGVEGNILFKDIPFSSRIYLSRWSATKLSLLLRYMIVLM